MSPSLGQLSPKRSATAQYRALLLLYARRSAVRRAPRTGMPTSRGVESHLAITASGIRLLSPRRTRLGRMRLFDVALFGTGPAFVTLLRLNLN